MEYCRGRIGISEPMYDAMGNCIAGYRWSRVSIEKSLARDSFLEWSGNKCFKLMLDGLIFSSFDEHLNVSLCCRLRQFQV